MTTDSEELWSALAGLLDSLPLGRSSTKPNVVRRGLRRADVRRGRAGLAVEHPRVALRSRCASGWRAHTGLEVVVDNDAKALALGEGWVGAARGQRDFIAMVVSTGVGGGIVLDGRLLDGAAGNAGHIGHVIVVPDGRLCVCGARGLPRSGGVGHRHTRDHRPAAERRAARRHRSHRPAGRSRRRVRWPTCSTCGSRSSPGRSRSASASRSSPRLRQSSTRSPGSSSRVAPGSCPRDSGATGRSSVRPPSPGRRRPTSRKRRRR